MITALYNFILINQREKNIYGKKQEEIDRKLVNIKENMEIKTNLAKKDRKMINEFCNKMIEDI